MKTDLTWAILIILDFHCISKIRCKLSVKYKYNLSLPYHQLLILYSVVIYLSVSCLQ